MSNKKFYDYFMCLAKIENGKCDRSSVFSMLESLSVKLLVAQEKHCIENSIHFHIYSRTENQLSVEDIISMVERELNLNCQIYFSECRSTRNCIRYATKEDFDCMFKNIDSKDFHLNYHIYYWALENEKFSILDGFVQKNFFFADYIESKHAEFRSTLRSVPFYKINVKKQFGNWRDLVIRWYNSFISKGIIKPLYLYGDSNVGKTQFIFSIFGCIAQNWFIPAKCNRDYAFSEWDSSKYNIVYIDHVNFDDFRQEDFKQIISGKMFSIKRKFMSSKFCVISSPIILVGNDEPQDKFKEYFYIVKAEYTNVIYANLEDYLVYDSTERFYL
ncbi:unnamed protein product [Brachionus calyciflorus]|uniref:Uncharacterized protein n=1 Tax=Brachionus calyciflorus TaxID=104777 RepID=A0A814JDZ8_9BILA|nr:unnamed protein product [Brachionus calyciflorus]